VLGQRLENETKDKKEYKRLSQAGIVNREACDHGQQMFAICECLKSRPDPERFPRDPGPTLADRRQWPEAISHTRSVQPPTPVMANLASSVIKATA
jgi:hypothetical protein